MWTKNNIPDQTGKIAIVTGSNTGIGFETALGLYQAGAHVIIASRDSGKASEAIKKMRAVPGKGSLQAGQLNLASLVAVQKFAETFHKEHNQLHMLINNAGVMVPPALKTEDGFELQFGVNFLGHFALTAHLYSILQQTDESRIVTLSSGAYKSVKEIDFENLRSEKSYDAYREYSVSKLAEMQFFLELQRRIWKAGHTVLSLAAHPGVTATNIARYMSEVDYDVAMQHFKELMPSWQGALPSLFAATSDSVIPGGYYGPDGQDELHGFPGPAVVNEAARDAGAAENLWQFAERATGISFL